MITIKPAIAILENFRRSSLGRALLPMGTGLGLPLPYVLGRRPYMIIPLLERGNVDQAKIENRVPVKKPVGELRFDLLSGRLVKFQLYTCDDPLPSAIDIETYAWFPPRAVLSEGWTRDKYQQEIEKLYAQMGDAANSLLSGDTYSASVKKFLEQFKRLLPSGLERYYPQILGSASILSPSGTKGDNLSPKTTPFDQPGS